MKTSALRGRIAWLDILVGSICLSVAVMILQLFSRGEKDRYDADQRLPLMTSMLVGAMGLVAHGGSKPVSENPN